MSSAEVKPQSIVHKIGRLGSKITKPISRRRQRIRMQRKLKVLEGSIKSSQVSATQSVSDASSIFAESFLTDDCSHDSEFNFSNHSAEATPDDDSSQGDYHTVDSEDFFSDIDEGEWEEEDGLFETVDQNELLTECFLTNEHSDMVFLIHFFNQETSISDAVEDTVSIRVLETKSKCECRRINSRSAPLFTVKLQIDPEQPTVVAIKNGKILSKVSNIASPECTEVNQWLTRTRILECSVSHDPFSDL